MHIGVNRFPLDANGSFGETCVISELEKADIKPSAWRKAAECSPLAEKCKGKVRDMIDWELGYINTKHPDFVDFKKPAALSNDSIPRNQPGKCRNFVRSMCCFHKVTEFHLQNKEQQRHTKNNFNTFDK